MGFFLLDEEVASFSRPIPVRSNIRCTAQTKEGTSSSELVEFAVVTDKVSSNVTGAEARIFSSRELP